MDIKAVITQGEQHVATELKDDLSQQLKDSQRTDSAAEMGSVRDAVLNMVVSERYERAIEELRFYVADRSAYPHFQDRAARFVEHCCDLIQAVQTKRNFPGVATLSMSKQRELHEKVIQHFNELKQNLKHIERIEREHRMSDVRSTVWVIYALTAVAFGVLAALVVLDLRSGLLTSTVEEASIAFEVGFDWVANHLPFL